jgi:hypothetical protein
MREHGVQTNSPEGYYEDAQGCTMKSELWGALWIQRGTITKLGRYK